MARKGLSFHRTRPYLEVTPGMSGTSAHPGLGPGAGREVDVPWWVSCVVWPQESRLPSPAAALLSLLAQCPTWVAQCAPFTS